MRYLLIIAFIVSSTLVSAQHMPILTQYMFNGVALNPALTGAENSFSVVGTYRAQWVGLPGAPKTQALSLHAPLKKENSALGLQFFADQIGVTKQSGIYFSYSYRLRFSNSALRLGVAGGTSIMQTNLSSLEVVHQNDAELNDNVRGLLPDFSFGAHFYTKKYFISFSIPFLLGHTYNGTNFKINHDFNNYHYYLSSGFEFDIDENLSIKPGFLFKYRPDIKPQADFNLMFKVNNTFEFGAGYRTQESLLFLFKYAANDQFQFMYSFGIPFSSIGAYSYGSHEIGLKYSFLYKTKISGPRYLGW